jgi:hypothetical protein
MEAAKGPRRPSDATSRPTESTPQEAPKASQNRADERCPTRYYPLFPLASRRRTPIRYC